MDWQMVYDWQAALVLLGLVIVVTVVGKRLAFLVPALAEARRLNLEEDETKRALPKYPPVVDASSRVGLAMNVMLYLLVAPFVVTLHPAKPFWWVLLDVVMILMVYDFFYYLTHRFLFHGQGYFRRVHAVHHQARSPTYIDALYVHPLETFIGLALFNASFAVVGLVSGDMDVVASAICIVLYTQINVVNHTKVNLPRFPFRLLTWITRKHAVHHENMHRGNYASITLLFDKLFGTLE